MFKTGLNRRESSSDVALHLGILILLLKNQVEPDASWRQAHRRCFRDGFVTLSHGTMLHELLRKNENPLDNPLCLPTSQDEEAFRKIWEEESNRSPVVSSNSSTWTQV